MHLYRIKIKPIGSFESELQSDTFFGAFCWSYRYSRGEDKLVDLLGRLKSKEDYLVFSDAFPSGTLPLPLGIFDSKRDMSKIVDKEERRDAYRVGKKIKNAKYISLEGFARIARGDTAGYSAYLSSDIKTNSMVVHNMVNRASAVVGKGDNYDSNLFGTEEYYVNAEQAYDLYLYSTLPEEVLQKVLKIMFLLGIGKDKSTGKGAFDMLDFTVNDELFENDEANAYVTLSNYIPERSDPIQGVYKTFVKYGKLDREYVNSQSPYKKPLLFIKPGAVFMSQSNKKIYGQIVENISERTGIVTSGCTIAIPIVKKDN